MRFVDKEVNPKQLSPLNLAFIGDCIYEILVRETLVLDANRPVNDLHRESVKFVSAKAQTAAFEKIKDILSYAPVSDIDYITSCGECQEFILEKSSFILSISLFKYK